MPDVNPKGHWKNMQKMSPHMSIIVFIILFIYWNWQLFYIMGLYNIIILQLNSSACWSLALSSSSLCWFSVRQLPRVGRRKTRSGCWGLCTCLISFTVASLPPSLQDWRERRACKIFPALLEMILQAHVWSAFCSALCNPWRAVSELGLMRVWQGRLQVVHAWQWQRSSSTVWFN